MSMTDFTIEELITITLAKSFKDREVGFTGLATGGAAALYITGIPLAAMEFARQTHAPNLTILLAGWSINPDFSEICELPSAEFDSKLQNLRCEAQMQSYPGHYAVRRGDVDFGFGSGVQVDRYGNVNSTCIGDYRKPEVRLVGSILLPEHMTCFRREYLMMPHHEVRSFVEQVDYVSGVGYPGGSKGREALGLGFGGPKWIVTPKCIFDFDAQSGEARLHSIHPGALLGTSMAGRSPDEVKPLICPFSGDFYLALKAAEADFTILHGYTADEFGNVQWPVVRDSDDIDQMMASGSRRLIVTVEKIIPHEDVRKRPALTYIPHTLVEAVVEMPYGAHPTSTDGFHDEDEASLTAYLATAKEPGGTAAYIREYILDTQNRDGDLAKFGSLSALGALDVTREA